MSEAGTRGCPDFSMAGMIVTLAAMVEDDPDTLERSAGVAFLGGLFAPGLGHWYVGHPRPAIGFVIALALGLPLVLLASAVAEVHAGIWVVVAGGWVLRFMAAVHAGSLAFRGQGRARRGQTLKGYVLFFIVTSSLAWLSGSVSRNFILEPLETPSDSMLPTMQRGDNFMVAKLAARDRQPQRGDIVVYLAPNGAQMAHRVVALPGETLRLGGAEPSIDGTPMTWEPCGDEPEHRCFVERTPEGASYQVQLVEPVEPLAPQTIEVPPGHVAILGDNRNQAHDSSAFGPISIDDVQGRVVGRFLPFDRVGTLIPAGAR